jgi:small subunit ribosomal protein S1
MSWTKRINHPSELVSVGEQVEVQVLNINRDKQEISLGMKQVQSNPWDKVAERYPKDTVVTGVVRNLTNYGAFVEIEEGIDGLLHVSDMSWVRKVTHPSEVLQKGDTVTCVVLNVDQERKRIALGLKQMKNDPWDTDIPARYRNGEVKTGKVTKITNFGVFIELEPGLEGLLHISELSDQKIDNPESLVNVGDDMEVKILRVDVPERKIGLSRKRLGWTAEEDEANPPAPAALNAGGSGASSPAAPAAAPARQSRELRGGTGSGGNLIEIPPS